MFLNIEDELLTKASILHVPEVVVSSFPIAPNRPANGTLFKKSWKPPQTPLITFIGTCKSQRRTISTENSRTWETLVEAQMLTADIDAIVHIIGSMLDVRMVASAFQFNGQIPFWFDPMTLVNLKPTPNHVRHSNDPIPRSSFKSNRVSVSSCVLKPPEEEKQITFSHFIVQKLRLSSTVLTEKQQFLAVLTGKSWAQLRANVGIKVNLAARKINLVSR